MAIPTVEITSGTQYVDQQLPGRYDVVLYQGDYRQFTLELMNNHGTEEEPDLQPVDLTDCEAHAQIRRRPGSSIVIATLETHILSPPESGMVQVVLPSADSVDILRHGRWDLIIVDPNGRAQAWLAGEVEVSRRVTNPQESA